MFIVTFAYAQDSIIVNKENDTIIFSKNEYNYCLDSCYTHTLQKKQDVEIKLDSISSCVKKKSFLTKAMDIFSNFFMGCDTNYVTPQKYQFTTQAELSYWHDFYYLKSSQTDNSMTIQSDPSMIVGGYVYYSILGYGLSWNVNDIGKPKGLHNGTSRRQSFSIHTAKIFAETYTFNSGKTAKITHVSGYDLNNKNNNFSGLDSRCMGVQAFYIFNNKHFSWPAAYGENAVQKRSCGTLNLGFSYNHQAITFDSEALPAYLQDMDSTLMFNKVDYNDYSVSIGYAYNCVLGRNVLFAFSLQPSIGYRRSNITEADLSHDILDNVSTDVNIRSSIFWNNSKYFTGLILDLHTYSYRQDKFGLTNTYGTLKFVMGLNFLKKSQYKNKK
ncbi:MAG: DUF4421 domain-containing protein [Bacteroidaceae bacterium]|nr:DUF4421 domain-containing protein [Bacteroidaceae bacterium]